MVIGLYTSVIARVRNISLLAIERRDQQVKRSDALILIAVWEFLTAVPLAVLIIAISAFGIPAIMDNGGGAGALFGVSVVMLILLALFGLAAGAGAGLLMRKKWGRIMALIHSALSILFVPFGTIIGIVAIIYLVTSQTREYFQSTGEQHGE